MAIKVVKKDKAKVLYSRIKNSSGADLTIDGQTLPDGEQVEEGKPNSAGFRFKFIKPRYIETSGNTIVDLMHFGRIPRSQSGFVGLLNEYPNAAFASSVRLLDASYTGGLVRVRAYRVIGSGGLDQGEADVLPDPSADYFISLNSPITNLDATALGRTPVPTTLGELLTNPSGTDYDGFVTTWYDQSGNANNATQTTASAQPQIASAGSLILDPQTNKPAMFGSGSEGLSSTSFIVAQPTTKFLVGHSNNSALNQIWSGSLDSNARHQITFLISNGGEISLFVKSAFNPSNPSTENLLNTTWLAYALFDGVSSEIGVNGGAVSIGNPGNSQNDGIATPTSFSFRGYKSEEIFYDSNKSADRNNIETNIGSAYGISLP